MHALDKIGNGFQIINALTIEFDTTLALNGSNHRYPTQGIPSRDVGNSSLGLQPIALWKLEGSMDQRIDLGFRQQKLPPLLWHDHPFEVVKQGA